MGGKKIEELKLKMIGEQFGRLEVCGYEISSNSAYKTYFYCHCACGNFCKIWGGSLRMGKTVSCGCYRAERAGQKKEMIGCRFTRLVVQEFVEIGKFRQTIYKCLCDCGNYCNVSGAALRKSTHSTKSCGCLADEGKRMRCGPNHYKYSNTITNDEREERRIYWRASGLPFETYKRDNFKCQNCGCKSTRANNFNAHHCISWSLCGTNSLYHINLRYDLDNLITLCEQCHIRFNRTYGYGYTTLEDTIDFLGFTPRHLDPLYNQFYDPIYAGA